MYISNDKWGSERYLLANIFKYLYPSAWYLICIHLYMYIIQHIMCAIVCVCDCTRVCQHCCVYVLLLTICFQAFPSIVQLWLTLERSGKQTALRARVAASWTHGGFLKLKLVCLAQCKLLLRSKWLDTKMIKHVVLPKKMLIYCMSQKGFWVLPVGKHSIPRGGYFPRTTSINICLSFAPFLRND